MKVSRRESVLALVTISVGLFGVSAMLARSRVDNWKELRAQQASLAAEIAQDRALAAEKEKWEKELAELSGMLPQYPADKKMDVYWLSFMDNLASKHGVKITRRKAGTERNQGDFYEMSIEVEHDGWEGDLSSLVHFLFDLQSEGAMLDVRQLRIKPKKGGTLAGRFSLYCAYGREP